MPNAQHSAESRTSGKRKNCHAFSQVEPALHAAVDLPPSGAVKSAILPGESETTSDIWERGNTIV